MDKFEKIAEYSRKIREQYSKPKAGLHEFERKILQYLYECVKGVYFVDLYDQASSKWLVRHKEDKIKKLPKGIEVEIKESEKVTVENIVQTFNAQLQDLRATVRFEKNIAKMSANFISQEERLERMIEAEVGMMQQLDIYTRHICVQEEIIIAKNDQDADKKVKRIVSGLQCLYPEVEIDIACVSTENGVAVSGVTITI